MLSRADNELLTRVGPGTAMGNLLRCFWQPFALASELPQTESDPIRVRLLGEDLVAVRDSAGTVGLIAATAHAEPDVRTNGRAVTYPVVDRGDVLWAYLGPQSADARPAPPEFEWTHVPASHRLVTKRIQFCNYLQNVEGEVDSSHVSFLHSKAPGAATAGIDDLRSTLVDYMSIDRAPRFFVLPTQYGLIIGARRNADADTYYWRITQYLMPTYTMIPVPVGFPISFTGATPMDDVTMMGFTVTWHPDRPLTDGEVGAIRAWTGVHTEVDPTTFVPVRNKDNDYLIDRAVQRSGASYTGIRGIREEDLAMQESMGPIVDRTDEHLGSADLAVISMRRRLLEAVRALADHGEVPYEARQPDAYRVRSAALVLPRDARWEVASAEALLARV